MPMTLEQFEDLLENLEDRGDDNVVEVDTGLGDTGLSIKLDENFFAKHFSELNLEGIMTTVKDNPLLHKLYIEGRLYISSKFRESGLKYAQDRLNALNSPTKESALKVLNELYDESRNVQDLLNNIALELKEYQNSSLASEYNLNALNSLDSLDDSLGSTKLQVHIEFFPRLRPLTIGKPASEGIGRADGYFPSEASRGYIDFCPLNLSDTEIIPPRITPKSLLGHELTHAVDYINVTEAQDKGVGFIGFQSPKKLQEYCAKFYPDQSGKEKLNHSLGLAAKFCSLSTGSDPFRLYSGYQFDQILNATGKINTGCPASKEFVSFYAEEILYILQGSKSMEIFQMNYKGFLKYKFEQIGSRVEFSNQDKLFALDVRKAYSDRYKEILSTNGGKDVVTVIDQIFDEYINTTLGDISNEILPEVNDKLQDIGKKLLDENIQKQTSEVLDQTKFNPNIDETVKSIVTEKDFQTYYAQEFDKLVLASDMLAVISQKAGSIGSIDYLSAITAKLKDACITSKQSDIDTYIKAKVKSIILLNNQHYIGQHPEEIAKKLDQTSQDKNTTGNELKTMQDSKEQIQTQITELDNQLKETSDEGTIAKINAEIEGLRTQLSHQEAEIEERNTRAKDIDAELSALDLSEYGHQIEDNRTEIGSYAKEIWSGAI